MFEKKRTGIFAQAIFQRTVYGSTLKIIESLDILRGGKQGCRLSNFLINCNKNTAFNIGTETFLPFYDGSCRMRVLLARQLFSLKYCTVFGIFQYYCMFETKFYSAIQQFAPNSKKENGKAICLLKIYSAIFFLVSPTYIHYQELLLRAS